LPVSDVTILDWKGDFRTDDTNSPSQNDWDSGVQRDLDDEFRNIKSVVRSWSQPAINKVWETVEKPNTIQFLQHGSQGFSIKVEFIDITQRLEPLQILKATRGSNTYYFVVTNAIMEAANTIIQVQPLPVQFTTTWSALAGNVLTAGVSLANPPATKPFKAYASGSPPVTGKQGLIIFDSSGHMSDGTCDQIADDTFQTYFTIPNLLAQGKVTAVSQIKQTWAINVYPDIATDTFVDNIFLGTKPSLFAKTSQSGSAQVTGDGTVGPYTLSNFPRTEPNASYQISLQVKGTSIATPTPDQLTWRVSAKTASNFTLTAAAAIPSGQTVSFDWMTHR